MLPFQLFSDALPYDSYLTTFGSPGDKNRWDRAKSQISLKPDQLELIQQFQRRANLLILAGAWCSDCSTQCAALQVIADANPFVQIRYLDRDAHPAARDELQVNGGHRVPVVVFYSEDGFEVGRYGDRVLATYRRLVQGVDSHELDLDNPDYAQAVTGDWLRELERVQWLLQLSPRLKRLHQD